jgi:hypothetical protein
LRLCFSSVCLAFLGLLVLLIVFSLFLLFPFSSRLIAIFSPLASFLKQFVILFIFFQLLELLQVPRVFYPFAGFLILLSGRVGTFLLALIFF